MKKVTFTQISMLCKRFGVQICMLQVFPEVTEFYTYHEFSFSQSGGSIPIDFCAFKGLNITEFIVNQHTDLSTVTAQTQFGQAFQSYLDSVEAVDIKFNKVIPYTLFT